MPVISFPVKKTRRKNVPDNVSSNSLLGNAFMAVAREVERTQINLSGLTKCASSPDFPNAVPIVVYGETESQLRRLVAYFRFPRLPFTYEELKGLTSYCDMLANSKGGLLAMPKKEQPLWKEVTLEVTWKYFPLMASGLAHYLEDDFNALSELHTEAYLKELADWWVSYEKYEAAAE